MGKKGKIIAITLAVLVLGLGTFFILFKPSPQTPKVQVPPLHPHLYKIDVENLNIVTKKVQRNDNLSTLLTHYITGSQLDKLSKETTGIFDFRKIKVDQKYTLLITKDSLQKLLYFIYEITPIDYVVYDFSDSIHVYLDKKDVKTSLETAEGTITSSLWNTFEENDLEPNLAMKMADIFAWTVDFYGLQKGDHFRLIYENIFVDSTAVGSGKILAARFTSGGKDIYAFHFDKGNVKGYFDDHGNSLERAFLKAPLHFTRISSRFSKSRMHPILRIARPHFGVDYSAPKGTPVVALGDGKITAMTWKGGYGRFIEIRHNSAYTTTYAHLSGYAKGLSAGSKVKQGELIGYVGSSGLSTGPHLDFRVYKNGSPVNPLALESPACQPVPQNLLGEYKNSIQKYDSSLRSQPFKLRMKEERAY